MSEKSENAGLLHQPEVLRSLAAQLRAEAERAEARAERLATGKESVGCTQGCWNIFSQCVWLTPL